MKIVRKIILIILLVSILCSISIFFYVSDYKDPDTNARLILLNNEPNDVKRYFGYLRIKHTNSNTSSKRHFIIMPTDNVDMVSYAYFANELSQSKYGTYIGSYPLNMFINYPESLNTIMNKYHDDEQFYIVVHHQLNSKLINIIESDQRIIGCILLDVQTNHKFLKPALEINTSVFSTSEFNLYNYINVIDVKTDYIKQRKIVALIEDFVSGIEGDW